MSAVAFEVSSKSPAATSGGAAAGAPVNLEQKAKVVRKGVARYSARPCERTDRSLDRAFRKGRAGHCAPRQRLTEAQRRVLRRILRHQAQQDFELGPVLVPLVPGVQASAQAP